MVAEGAVWGIIALPLAAGALAAAALLPALRPLARASGYVAILGVGGAFALSLLVLDAALGADGAIGFPVRSWLTVGDPTSAGGFEMTVGLLLDPLSAVMVALVSGVSMLVMLFSLGYMRKAVDGEGGAWADYPRYFAYMSWFTAAMLGLVLALNLIQLFVFWELVGLFSYLLIGFWYHRPAAAAAAKKAFIITRIGDFGFMLALLYLYLHRAEFLALDENPFEIPAILAAAPLLPVSVAMWVSLGILAGAMGKSAQFPLNTWLPDAMEGPTPVSSLIHAATMVAAGVFLVARMFPLFAESTVALNAVAIVGGTTAVLAAAMGVVANDIKRVLAFSTVSQLGYMFLALGVGAWPVAIFHLLTHAFFKCLLFLSAGSVHHSVHTFDMRYMGGLRAWMPVTYVLTLIGALSLMGIAPLAGFWSKDEVLAAAWSADGAGSVVVSRLVFVLGMAAVFMTAFYVSRLVLMTFHGEFRGGIDAVPDKERIPDEAHLVGHVHRAESPLVMTLPMAVLAVLAIIAGVALNALTPLGPLPVHGLTHFLGGATRAFDPVIAGASTLLALTGIGLALGMHRRGSLALTDLPQPWSVVHRFLARRLYMDHLYETLIVRRVLYRGLFLATDWADRRLVDGTVDVVGWVGRNGGRAVAQLQTGQVQVYGVAVFMGVIVMLVLFMFQR